MVLAATAVLFSLATQFVDSAMLGYLVMRVDAEPFMQQHWLCDPYLKSIVRVHFNKVTVYAALRQHAHCSSH